MEGALVTRTRDAPRSAHRHAHGLIESSPAVSPVRGVAYDRSECRNRERATELEAGAPTAGGRGRHDDDWRRRGSRR